MSQPKTYPGSCHCGKVRYEVTTALGKVIECNCSMCSRRGWALTFVTADQFKLVSGEDALTDYQFNKKNVHHLFCKVCGVSSFTRGTGADGQAMVSINVRCLDGVDWSYLEVVKHDGKNR